MATKVKDVVTPAVSTTEVSTGVEQQEQQIVNQIQKLLPGARKSGKDIGEQLFKLQNLCKEKGERFRHHLKTLGIAPASAYLWIGLYKNFVIEDYQFPVNVVRFAQMANIDITDMSYRAILYEALIESGVKGGDPTDAEAIAIVGSASAAIAAARAKANKAAPPPLNNLQQCLAEQDAAFMSMYRLQTKGTKKGTQRVAAEQEYVRIALAFLHPGIAALPGTKAQYQETGTGAFEKIEGTEVLVTPEERQTHANRVRDLLLRLGRGETTLYQEFKPMVDAGLWFF